MVKIRFYHFNVATCDYDPETELHGRTWTNITKIGADVEQKIGTADAPTTITRSIFSYNPSGEGDKIIQRLLITILPYKSSEPDNLYYAHQSILLLPFEYRDEITLSPSRN